MSWVAAAVAGSTLVGGYLGSQASGKAADAQTNAANNSLALQKQMYDQTRQDLSPWRSTGAQAQNRLAIMLGLQPAVSTDAGNFNGAAYLAANPDVAADPYFAQNPLAHYLQYGQNELGKGVLYNGVTRQLGGATPTAASYQSDPAWGTALRPTANALKPYFIGGR